MSDSKDETGDELRRKLEDAKGRIAELETLLAENALATVAIEEEGDLYRTLFEGSPGGLALTTPTGRIIAANRSMATIMGYSSEELILLQNQGHSTKDIYINPEDRNRALKILSDTGLVQGFETRLRHKDGHTIHASLNMRAMDFHGGPHILTTLLDLTDLREAENAVHASERYFRSLWDSVHAGIMLIDIESHTIADVNPFAQQLIGLDKDDVTGHICHKFVCPAEEGKCPVTDLGQLVERSERKLLTKDGEEIPILKTVTPITLNDKDMLLESFVSISELKKAQKALQQAHDHLEDKVEERTAELAFANSDLTSMNEKLSKEIADRIRVEEKLRELATIDALTGTNNRQQFVTLAKKELIRAKRYNEPLVLLMLDIDYFKAVNDTYGHDAGDSVLCKVTDTCLTTLRETDIFGRLGGEEFAAVLLKTELDDALDIAERLREMLAATTVKYGKEEIGITVSIGLATLSGKNETIKTLIKKADLAMYEAKRTGRNKVAAN